MKCCVALIAFLVLAAPAQAGWKTDRAVAIANTVWGNPCDGRATVAYETTYDFFAWADEERCQAVFNSGMRRTWLTFCTTMIHEFGHLAHYRTTNPYRTPSGRIDWHHSNDPHSVMYVIYAEPDRRCRRNGRPYLEQHGRLTPRPTSLRKRT